MSDYIYKEPKGTRYKLSIKQWNSKLGYRGRWPFIYTCLWVDGDSITIHHYYTIWAKLVMIFLYPVIIITDGYKEANRELYRTWHNKKSGSFSRDMCYRPQESWKKIEELLGRKL